MKKTAKNSRVIKPGGVPEYIAGCPKSIQSSLKDMRATIRAVVPDAIETVSYFDMPGYSYEGYAYNGMFVWFSFKEPFVRIHVRPEAIVKYKKDVEKYSHSKAVISFDPTAPIPKALVKKLVKASLQSMKALAE
jgi:uncharacterized protein YdhG (YjbR/CyaY superfamily)